MMSNVIEVGFGKKPPNSDSAYHLLYHIPTNYSNPVATLGNINLKGNSDA